MPRFSQEKQERIRRALLDAGCDRFERYGLQGTTIADLTDDVGIADGTFYSFFDSKEALFAAVLRREAEQVYDDLTAVLDEADDAETGIRRFLETASDATVEHPSSGGPSPGTTANASNAASRRTNSTPPGWTNWRSSSRRYGSGRNRATFSRATPRPSR
ncbi:TetR/AcrR family transcriptional regulator [Halobacteriaceae archaeon GCM10025711]